MRILRTAAILLVLVLLPAPASPLAADQATFRVGYIASLYGLPIGRAFLESRFQDRSFSIAGNFSSAGIARIFDRTDGMIAATAQIGSSANQPAQYVLEYSSGRKQKRTSIRFSRGTVVETINLPERNQGVDWVPVTKDHLAGVSDPLTALLLPAESTGQICNRSLRVFDGEIRVDLELTAASPRESFRNAMVTCRVHFRPVAGYRKNSSSITFLRERARILIGFQAVHEQNLYFPVEASIATKVGTVHIRARAG